MVRNKTWFYSTLALLTSALLLIGNRADAQTTGFVYVATNQPSGNMVIQYRRASDGSLTKASQVATGGLGGTGNGVGDLDPLGSQDSLVLSGTGSLLLAVNAGSNQVSSIRVTAAGLQLASTVRSGGSFPNSVALNGELIYVVNAHGTPNISGFRVSVAGTLQPIAGSTRALPGGSTAAPHDIRFSPDGTRLLVTEGGTNQIDVFQLNNSGVATAVTTQSSAGSGPFGIRFARGDVLANAEANTASVSSYDLTADNTLQVISAAVPDGGAAACWITLTGTRSFAFVSNTGSGTISSYHIAKNGTLDLANAIAGSLGSGAPIDSALSSDSAFFYVDDSALGRVVIFRVRGASLKPLGSVTGLPKTLQGVAAQ
jgi:6-phosphogluconolactonase (cycloisomerase 2 family)